MSGERGAEPSATTGVQYVEVSAERAGQPCIGPERADLVLAGAAILQAVQELWPCTRVRVADRGLREGILMSLMSGAGKRKRRRRRRRGRGSGTGSTVNASE